MNCYICGGLAYHAYGDSFAVRECQRCERPVCENCAEMDADCVGDPPRYVLTAWLCDSLKGGCREQRTH